MAGLVGYASSDEEDEVKAPQKAPVTSASEEAGNLEKSKVPEKPESTQQPEVAPGPQLPAEELSIGPVQQNAAPLGPSLPPLEDSYGQPGDSDQAPGSPYSSNRAIIHDLTLPSVPNLDIPPSPPGSPPPGANKKFEQFLALKKKGVHFNSKLENSTALRNPSLMDKLMGFVGIDEKTQYETTLPPDLWNPKAFPDWAFRDRLKKSQEKIAKEREAERSGGGRTAVDFVPSSSTTPVAGSTSNAGGISRGEKRRGGWN